MPITSATDALHRLNFVKLLILDCDGVLTDGRITLQVGGDESKTFDVRDGLGLRLAIQSGLRIGIITGRQSRVVEARVRELGIHHLHQNISDKRIAFQAILQEENLPATAVAYIGDDLPDIPVMRQVGFAIAVGDASMETKAVAHYVTTRPGGQGAVREAVELILKQQAKWDQLLNRFFQET